MKYLFIIILIGILAACDTRKSTPQQFTIIIYLQDEAGIDTLNDIRFLETFPHVSDVDFVSKEDAKKEYLADRNEDWSKVLDSNPLPASYLVIMNDGKISKKDIEEMEMTIRERIPYCSDINYPEPMLKE